MSKSGNGRPCRLRGSLGRGSEGRRRLKRWSASICLVGDRRWRRVEGLDCGKLGWVKSSDWTGVIHPESCSDRCSFQSTLSLCSYKADLMDAGHVDEAINISNDFGIL